MVTPKAKRKILKVTRVGGLSSIETIRLIANSYQQLIEDISSWDNIFHPLGIPWVPVVRTPCLTAEGLGPIPGQGTKIPQSHKLYVVAKPRILYSTIPE